MQSTETTRCFIATAVPLEVRARIVSTMKTLRDIPASISWVPEENIHLTLRFLGDLKRTSIESVKEELRSIASSHRSFKLSYRDLGTFPRRARPRVIWAGAFEDGEELASLWDDLNERLAEIGFQRPKRRFTPHLTLGRVRGSLACREFERYREKLSNLTFGEGWVENLLVMQSILQPGKKACYLPLASFTLGGP